MSVLLKPADNQKFSWATMVKNWHCPKNLSPRQTVGDTSAQLVNNGQTMMCGLLLVYTSLTEGTHIFISYSSKDIKFTLYLCALLEKEGFSIWMDKKSLSPVMKWCDGIQKVLNACGALVIIMLPHSQESKFVQSEILYAIDQMKPIFPVLLVGEPFFLLKAYQYEDLRVGLSARLSS
jgi:hypothetical protein